MSIHTYVHNVRMYRYISNFFLTLNLIRNMLHINYVVRYEVYGRYLHYLHCTGTAGRGWHAN